MMYAISKNEKILARPDIKDAVCPGCNAEVIAKCGNINVWHYAHKVSSTSCLDKEETEWHRSWKGLFRKECVEIKMGNCRADVRVGDTSIEFQNAQLTRDEIFSRKLEHGKIIWVVNLNDVHMSRISFPISRKGNRYLKIKWPIKWLDDLMGSGEVYLDIRDDWEDLVRVTYIIKKKVLFYQEENKERFLNRFGKYLASNKNNNYGNFESDKQQLSLITD